MPQSLSQVYVHIIFSTKGRTPWITPYIQKELYPYMSAIFKAIKSPALIIGGMPDHIHTLAIQSKNIAMCKLIEEIKKPSSKWIKTRGSEFKGFRWQSGYGSFSVSPSHVEKVKQYIVTQRLHHDKRTFQDEFRLFLEKYKIEYDEKYVWD